MAHVPELTDEFAAAPAAVLDRDGRRPARAREVLGWTAERGLDEIVWTAFDWHRSQV